MKSSTTKTFWLQRKPNIINEPTVAKPVAGPKKTKQGKPCKNCP